MTERLRDDSYMSPLEQAQRASEWFADCMYGFRDDVDEALPVLARQRLSHCFTTDTDPSKIVGQIREVFSQQEYDGQCGLALYFSGYPDDSLEILLDDPSQLARLLKVEFLDKKITSTPPVRRIPEVVPQHRHDEVLPVATKLGGIVLTDGMLVPIQREGYRWQDDALCAQTDPEAFFPEKGGSTREAKSVCLGCDVKSECLNAALDNDERFGIWGGLSERERRKLKRGHEKFSETSVIPFLRRDKRIGQLLEAVTASQSEFIQYTNAPKFAQLAYGLIHEAYGGEEVDEEVGERLRLYFVTARKQKEVKDIIEHLEDDLDDFFSRLKSMKNDYKNEAISFADFYAMTPPHDSRAAELGVSRVVRRRVFEESSPQSLRESSV